MTCSRPCSMSSVALSSVAKTSRRPVAGVLPVIVSVLLTGAGGTAADAQQNGHTLTFGVGLRAEADNLTNPGRGITRLLGDLTFGISSATDVSTLTLDGALQLRANDQNSSSALSSSNVALSYGRAVANADLSVKTSIASTDLAIPRAVIDFDLGGGTRTTAQASGALNWGTATPLGVGLSAAWSDTVYKNNTDPTLIDTSSVTLGANVRMDLSKTTALTAGLTHTHRADATGLSSDTLDFDAGLVLARPRSDMGLTLSVSNLQNNPRVGLTFDNSVTLPNGTLTYTLGTTQGQSGQRAVTGALAYATALPNGSLSFDLKRSLQSVGASAIDNVQSSASVQLVQAITPLANLDLSLNWAQKQDGLTNLTSANTNLSAVWSQSVTPDWAVNLGYTHRLQVQDPASRNSSDMVFLELRRSFSSSF
jgi:hypothetical protein